MAGIEAWVHFSGIVKFLASEIAVSRKGGMEVRRLNVGDRRSDVGWRLLDVDRGEGGDECG